MTAFCILVMSGKCVSSWRSTPTYPYSVLPVLIFLELPLSKQRHRLGFEKVVRMHSMYRRGVEQGDNWCLDSTACANLRTR